MSSVTENEFETKSKNKIESGLFRVKKSDYYLQKVSSSSNNNYFKKKFSLPNQSAYPAIKIIEKPKETSKQFDAQRFVQKIENTSSNPKPANAFAALLAEFREVKKNRPKELEPEESEASSGPNFPFKSSKYVSKLPEDLEISDQTLNEFYLPRLPDAPGRVSKKTKLKLGGLFKALKQKVEDASSTEKVKEVFKIALKLFVDEMKQKQQNEEKKDSEGQEGENKNRGEESEAGTLKLFRRQTSTVIPEAMQENDQRLRDLRRKQQQMEKAQKAADKRHQQELAKKARAQERKRQYELSKQLKQKSSTDVLEKSGNNNTINEGEPEIEPAFQCISPIMKPKASPRLQKSLQQNTQKRINRLLALKINQEELHDENMYFDLSLAPSEFVDYEEEKVGIKARRTYYEFFDGGDIQYNSYWMQRINLMMDSDHLKEVYNVGYYSRLGIENKVNLQYQTYRYLSLEKQTVYEEIGEIYGKTLEDINIDEDILCLHTDDDQPILDPLEQENESYLSKLCPHSTFRKPSFHLSSSQSPGHSHRHSPALSSHHSPALSRSSSIKRVSLFQPQIKPCEKSDLQVSNALQPLSNSPDLKILGRDYRYTDYDAYDIDFYIRVYAPTYQQLADEDPRYRFMANIYNQNEGEEF